MWPHLLRNALPKALSFRNGFLGSTTRALPGISPSCSPCMTAMKESVVGSGPIRIPGKSCSIRCRIKVVFPVEYWPTKRTIGLLSKSASSKAGEWKSWKRYASSKGKSLVRYSRRSPSETVWNSSGSFFLPFLLVQLNILSELWWTLKLFFIYGKLCNRWLKLTTHSLCQLGNMHISLRSKKVKKGWRVWKILFSLVREKWLNMKNSHLVGYRRLSKFEVYNCLPVALKNVEKCIYLLI